MNMGLNAAQARANSSQDLIVFEETNTIMRTIINASDAGDYEAYVGDDTTMTTSTPEAKKIGVIQNPTITPGNTLIINGSTVVLGTTGTNLNSIIADINDAGITGVVASKDNGHLVLTIEIDAATTWTYTIGAGTANTEVGLTTGTYTVSDPVSVSYFNAWQGTLTDRGLQSQMDQVSKYFVNMGYKIERITNTDTSKTFKWHIYW
jgi:hypothetical protein